MSTSPQESAEFGTDDVGSVEDPTLPPLDEDEENNPPPDHDDPIDDPSQMDAKLGDEQPGEGSPDQLPPPVQGPP